MSESVEQVLKVKRIVENPVNHLAQSMLLDFVAGVFFGFSVVGDPNMWNCRICGREYEVRQARDVYRHAEGIMHSEQGDKYRLMVGLDLHERGRRKLLVGVALDARKDYLSNIVFARPLTGLRKQSTVYEDVVPVSFVLSVM